MKVTFYPELSVPVGFLVIIEDNGLSITLYRYPREDDPKELIQDGVAISNHFADTEMVLSAPVRLSYPDLQQRAEFSDYALWALPLYDQNLQQPFGLPFNRAVETQVSKRTREESLRRQENVPIRLMVPFKSSKLADCTLHVSTHPDLPLIVNAEAIQMDLYQSIAQAMPVIRLAKPVLKIPADGYGVAEVAVTDQGGAILPVGCDLYLEETGGYLPRRRIPALDGKASFKVGALGLEPGDSFKVKLGFRHYSGLADLVVRVV